MNLYDNALYMDDVKYVAGLDMVHTTTICSAKRTAWKNI